MSRHGESPASAAAGAAPDVQDLGSADAWLDHKDEAWYGSLESFAKVSVQTSMAGPHDPSPLGPPEEKPPPEVAEVVRVPLDDEGREIGITG